MPRGGSSAHSLRSIEGDEEKALRAQVSAEHAERLLADAKAARALAVAGDALALTRGARSAPGVEACGEAHLVASEACLYLDDLDAASRHAARARASALRLGELEASTAVVVGSELVQLDPPIITSHGLEVRSEIARIKAVEFRGKWGLARIGYDHLLEAEHLDPVQNALGVMLSTRSLACSVKRGDVNPDQLHSADAEVVALRRMTPALLLPKLRWHACALLALGELDRAGSWINFALRIKDRGLLESIKLRLVIARHMATEGSYDEAEQLLSALLEQVSDLGLPYFVRRLSET